MGRCGVVGCDVQVEVVIFQYLGFILVCSFSVGGDGVK